jgi:hypothetical protein
MKDNKHSNFDHGGFGDDHWGVVDKVEAEKISVADMLSGIAGRFHSDKPGTLRPRRREQPRAKLHE